MEKNKAKNKCNINYKISLKMYSAMFFVFYMIFYKKNEVQSESGKLSIFHLFSKSKFIQKLLI
ncbi:hypothetical protein MCANUFG1_00250 [Mycoplasmopsis canis UFG1]|nr:hypothetical protein MCANUFG1_00250 [Mycoplasmopsis canis UFG1]